MEPPSGMTIRVKRQKVTVFCTVEPADTVLAVKAKLSFRVGHEPAKQRLYFNGALLEDTQRLSDAGVDGESALVIAYQTAGGTWEEPVVSTPQDSKDEGGRAFYE